MKTCRFFRVFKYPELVDSFILIFLIPRTGRFFGSDFLKNIQNWRLFEKSKNRTTMVKTAGACNWTKTELDFQNWNQNCNWKSYYFLKNQNQNQNQIPGCGIGSKP
jgi:hypothetical protein